jgi:hypothetical protein
VKRHRNVYGCFFIKLQFRSAKRTARRIPADKGRHLFDADIAQPKSTPMAPAQLTVTARQGFESSKKLCAWRCWVRGVLENLARKRLHDGKSVPGAMVQLAHQKRLVFLRCGTPRNHTRSRRPTVTAEDGADRQDDIFLVDVG